jgi:hypothetical protein
MMQHTIPQLAEMAGVTKQAMNVRFRLMKEEMNSDDYAMIPHGKGERALFSDLGRDKLVTDYKKTPGAPKGLYRAIMRTEEGVRIMAGTSDECARKLGLTARMFIKYANNPPAHFKWQIERIE